MNKYQAFSHIVDFLDLHNLNGVGVAIIEADVWSAVDGFIGRVRRQQAAKLKRGFTVKIGIVVGKGTGSKNWIRGKNPLRVYTENYLDQCGFSWRNGRLGEGEEGVIVVEVD